MITGGPKNVLRPRDLSASVRATLAARGLYASGYQPPHMFTKPRRLLNCAEPGDPWRAAVYRLGMTTWHEGACIGWGVGETADEAVLAALASGGLQNAIGGLTAALDSLTGVLRRA